MANESREKMRLNLGCGSKILPGYINLDKFQIPGVDVVHDLEKYPYPFKANTFLEVECNMILEHINDLVSIMKELHRICKHGALLKIKVPYFSCASNFIDPTHKRLFSYYSFDFFTGDEEYNEFMFDSSMPVFKIVKRKIIFYSIYKIFEPFFNLKFLVKPYTGALSYIIPAGELYFELKVIK